MSITLYRLYLHFQAQQIIFPGATWQKCNNTAQLPDEQKFKVMKNYVFIGLANVSLLGLLLILIY